MAQCDSHGSSILPKLDLRQIVSSVHPRRTAVEPREDISLPKINSSTDNVSLMRTPSDSNPKPNSTKRLTIQIPTASGDVLVMATNKEKQTKANNNTKSRTLSTSSTQVKPNTHSQLGRSSDRSLLAPTCSSYSGPVGQPMARRSIEHLIEGSALHVARPADESIQSKTVDGVDNDRQVQLAVLPAISNASASASTRFNELKLNNSSSSSPLSSIIGSVRRLKRGSVVMGEKAVKRSISLRVS